jgi:UDP-GlcNAc3NAcA epimerase
MRVIIVIGTRPQIIKSAPIIDEAKGYPHIDLLIVHTGQHYDFEMSKEFFNELNLPDPVVNLGVGSGSHAEQTAAMMVGLEKTYKELKPDVVLVPGDTNSTLAAALTASKMHIQIAHIESGARSGDMTMPEEINRRVVDHISDLLFAVSENCVANLMREGIPSNQIKLVGDTMYESIQNHISDIEKENAAEDYGLEKKRFGVLTLHRAENTDDEKRLSDVIGSLSCLDLDIIFPCHPRTRDRLAKLNLYEEATGRLRIVKPLPYFRMLNLVKDAGVVLTDSGGLQKEAFWLDTPCVTLRTSTEWVETIEAGMNVLVGWDQGKLIEAVMSALRNGSTRSGLIRKLTPINASQRILETLDKLSHESK